jgi:hypothetical protein
LGAEFLVVPLVKGVIPKETTALAVNPVPLTIKFTAGQSAGS